MSFYAATKIANEEMAHSYAHLFGIPTTMFRFFTVYGTWGRPDMALFKFTRATKPTSTEIAEIRYFAFDDLPESIDPGTMRRMREIIDGTAPSETWSDS